MQSPRTGKRDPRGPIPSLPCDPGERNFLTTSWAWRRTRSEYSVIGRQAAMSTGRHIDVYLRDTNVFAVLAQPRPAAASTAPSPSTLASSSRPRWSSNECGSVSCGFRPRHGVNGSKTS
jgi:hypothetical protein